MSMFTNKINPRKKLGGGEKNNARSFNGRNFKKRSQFFHTHETVKQTLASLCCGGLRKCESSIKEERNIKITRERTHTYLITM